MDPESASALQHAQLPSDGTDSSQCGFWLSNLFRVQSKRINVRAEQIRSIGAQEFRKIPGRVRANLPGSSTRVVEGVRQHDSRQ